MLTHDYDKLTLIKVIFQAKKLNIIRFHILKYNSYRISLSYMATTSSSMSKQTAWRNFK